MSAEMLPAALLKRRARRVRPSVYASAGSDEPHLLELCGLVGARVIETDGTCDPHRPSDRLLLGMKGSISEFGFGMIRARMRDARHGKALRGVSTIDAIVDMPVNSHEILRYLKAPEGACLEFKEAKGGFHFEKLVEYVVALANTGGGKVILGVTDRRPRQIVGTQAFPEPGRTEAGLFDRLGHHVPIEECLHEGHRILIVHVPAREPGSIWEDRGVAWWRAGDALVPLTNNQRFLIFLEAAPDFSAQLCSDATLADLDPDAIANFRFRWAAKAKTDRILNLSDEQLLADTELMADGKLTYAALILFGTRAGLGKHLARSEIVFEYRSNDLPGPAQDRQEYREGFLLCHDAIWNRINLRNDNQSYQDRFFRIDVPTFDEEVTREAILNAVCHREYHLEGSVFVRQYSRRLEIINPGGFPNGITVQNILDEQRPRNRRLADAFARCGLVERAGQGMDLIFERTIRHSKALPDFERSGASSSYGLHDSTLSKEFEFGSQANGANLAHIEVQNPGNLLIYLGIQCPKQGQVIQNNRPSQRDEGERRSATEGVASLGGFLALRTGRAA